MPAPTRSIARSPWPRATLQRDHRPDLTNTSPADPIGPHPQWADPDKIVSLDPWGHLVAAAFAEQIAAGTDMRPTIAVTKAHINMPELKDGDRRRAAHARRRDPLGQRRRARDQGRHRPRLVPAGHRERFDVKESSLRRALFEQTGGHVPRARHAPRPQGLPAADRRHDGLLLRRRGEARQARDARRLPRARRVQRLGRVRLRHLHLPAVPRARHRGLHRDGAAGRRRASSSTTARKAARWAR